MPTLRVTSDFCRKQEAVQRAKAATEPLENRRKIALEAAKAWEAEAFRLEQHEAGDTPLDKLDAGIALEFAREAASPAGGKGPVPKSPVPDGR
ncbi:hypothetical protein [Qipengyuania zhejiangensis]|uniref:hypothetical protein n=1 Tax=Qipengyuania zhejiangensis TaxID=3077782 RepID=UPI002D79CB73|nr:hypothetical protein [Qipengyuania sp. Z2]